MAEPISLDEAKAFLRVDGSDEDNEISSAISDACGWIEDYTGLVLVPATIVETFDAFCLIMKLKSWPISTITSVEYLDVAGAPQMLSIDGFRAALATRPARLSPSAQWPRSLGSSLFRGSGSPGSVTVTLHAGYATPDEVPRPIVRALKLMVGHFYINRSAVEAGARAAAIEIPFAVEALLRRYRYRTL